MTDYEKKIQKAMRAIVEKVPEIDADDIALFFDGSVDCDSCPIIGYCDKHHGQCWDAPGCASIVSDFIRDDES